VQTAKLKQFVSNSRKKLAADDARTSWALESRSLASQVSACEQDLATTLTALLTDGHIPSTFFHECQDANTMYGQLYAEEACQAKATASKLYAAAKSLKALGDRSGIEAGQLLSELARECELQWRHVLLLESDTHLLTQEVRCVP
jgi:hypothetical protein